MADEIETGPEGPEPDLVNAVRESLPLIRQLAVKPRHILAMGNTTRSLGA